MEPFRNFAAISSTVRPSKNNFNFILDGPYFISNEFSKSKLFSNRKSEEDFIHLFIRCGPSHLAVMRCSSFHRKLGRLYF